MQYRILQTITIFKKYSVLWKFPIQVDILLSKKNYLSHVKDMNLRDVQQMVVFVNFST